MQTLTHKFKNSLLLAQFIEKNILVDNSALLIQIFSGVKTVSLVNEVRELINQKLPNAKIIGASTAGEIYLNEVFEYEIIINFSIFQKSTVAVMSFSLDMFDEEEIADMLCEDLVTENSKTMILFADGLECNGEKLLNRLYVNNPEVVYSGGLSADNAQMQSTYTIDNHRVVSRSVVAAVIDSEVLIVNSGFQFNFTPIGLKMKVTSSFENRVYTINDINAYDIYIYEVFRL
jgi:c-di-GMP phosphodiesterase